VRDNYKYKIMVQIELSAINGLSCIGSGDAAKINESKEIL